MHHTLDRAMRLGCARNAPKRRKVSRGFWKSMPGPEDEPSGGTLLWNLPLDVANIWRNKPMENGNFQEKKPNQIRISLDLALILGGSVKP